MGVPRGEGFCPIFEALRAFPWVICRLDSAENAVVGRDLAFRPKSRKHNTWNDRETRSLVSWDRPSQEHFRAGARPEGPTITHEEPQIVVQQFAIGTGSRYRFRVGGSAGQCAELGSPLQWVQSSAQVVPQVVDVLQADGQAE